MSQVLQWSQSRAQLFRKCQHWYWYTYILSWGGWLANAPPESKRAYALKHMTNLPALVGSVVHDIIEGVLKARRQTGRPLPPEEEVVARGHDEFKMRMEMSATRLWLTQPKATHLHEHHFNLPILPSSIDHNLGKVRDSLANWCRGPAVKWIKRVPTNQWMTLEDFQAFDMKDGARVSVKIDFGFRHNGLVHLLDWKTGRPCEDIADQLTTYVMYAWKQWKCRYETVAAIPVYLASEELACHPKPIGVDMDRIMRQAKVIGDEYRLLAEGHARGPDGEKWPKTECPKNCEDCPFREECGGA